MKPVLFVTGHAPASRVGAFACLHEREDVEFALFGGRLKHGGGPTARELPFPHRRVRERELYALAASGRYRAVVVSTGGRMALGGAWAGARRARLPVILWASLWAHPRSAAHALSYPALLRLYRSADAVVTYGPHVSAYVRARGARCVHVAPQSVDNAFWRSPAVSIPSSPRWPAGAGVKFLFAGRAAREKGLGVLVEAWSTSGLQAPTAALVLVGAGSTPPWVPAGGAVVGRHGAMEDHGAMDGDGAMEGEDRAIANREGTVVRGDAGTIESGQSAGVVGFETATPAELRNFYAAADVLVVPSISTRTFREPWGLVSNEAMNRGLPVIASDAVGAAAGGLVRDRRNGLVVPAGDPVALAAALRQLAREDALRARLGAAAREDVSGYTHAAWAEGFSSALAGLGLSGGR
ncbi:MAG TPA: glycosyltransferase family 4 protein [Solirubrobacteraceae bacterium]|nr:glycosyltransferase family 4 protein [Solirubrobacteraceae bacterium]